MHIVNDVHGIVVYTCYLGQYFFIVSHYFFKLQHLARQHRNIFYHYRTGVFTTSTVDSQQQCFGKIGTCAEELYLLTDFLIGYAAGDTIVVRLTYFAHQIVVFVLYGRGVDGNFCTEFFETFR